MIAPSSHAPFDDYRGRRVLVTGGLGFIGSNLARRLVDLGAEVRILDALVAEMGGTLHNVDGFADRLAIRIADMREWDPTTLAVDGCDIIFNLAGQVSHIDSLRDPRGDLGINVDAQLQLLDVLRHHNPRARVVFTSTRHVYGRAQRVPVDETHPIHPPDVNAINKVTAEAYHRLYQEIFGIPSSILRLTNVYGPRQLIRHNRQGFIGWFVRLAMEDREIEVYGDGSQQRDLLFVDDAVEALLLVGLSEACVGRTLNVGGPEPIAHRDLVKRLIAAAGTGRARFVDWPADRKAIDVGSVWLDSTRLHEATGWQPRTSLDEGLARTVAYYRPRLAAYCAPAGAGEIELA
ncbi:MAG TPA: NAD-dependent epimerase/dehydratase family protein [Vicinamibacterales bacterium]|jgi:UDP-glucose 4-epimerase